jgi:hypothetical protein
LEETDDLLLLDETIMAAMDATLNDEGDDTEDLLLDFVGVAGVLVAHALATGIQTTSPP